MIKRTIETVLMDSLKQYPIIVITGPRQSGKTTLCRSLLKDYTYINLERPDNREMVLSDPVGFLNRFSKDGVILDEIQQCPSLFSYLQAHVDESRQLGKIVLTGSQNFLMSEKISQSLAGRARILKLLPFSIDELADFSLYKEKSTDDILFSGLYPPVYDRPVSPNDWYNNYIETYLERDVRQISNISNLHLFQKFLGMCAGRIGQLLSVSSLSTDLGVSSHTVKSWFGILEASYIIILLQPYHNNVKKRLVKQPKLYFVDTGLAAALMKIDSPYTLSKHYLRGNLYENLAIIEYLKYRYNHGSLPNCYFWRDNHGYEVDLIIDNITLSALEIKSGETFNNEMTKGIRYWKKIDEIKKGQTAILYGGTEPRFSPDTEIIPLHELNMWFKQINNRIKE